MSFTRPSSSSEAAVGTRATTDTRPSPSTSFPSAAKGVDYFQSAVTTGRSLVEGIPSHDEVYTPAGPLYDIVGPTELIVTGRLVMLLLGIGTVLVSGLLGGSALRPADGLGGGAACRLLSVVRPPRLLCDGRHAHDVFRGAGALFRRTVSPVGAGRRKRLGPACAFPRVRSRSCRRSGGGLQVLGDRSRARRTHRRARRGADRYRVPSRSVRGVRCRSPDRPRPGSCRRSRCAFTRSSAPCGSRPGCTSTYGSHAVVLADRGSDV